MMKKIFFSLLICAFTGFFAASCIRDNGNYDYKQGDDVKDFSITPFGDAGLNDTTVYMNRMLTIDPYAFPLPLFTGDTEGCTFRWFIMRGLTASSGVSTSDTIVLSRQSSPMLDLLLLPPNAKPQDYPEINFDNYDGTSGGKYPLISTGTYLLYFEISRDGMSEVSRSPIRLEILPGDAKMTLQWFILKDNGTSADFDFYDPNQQDESKRLQSDILAKLYQEGELKLAPTYSNPQGVPLELPAGAPVSIVYSPWFFLDFEGLESTVRVKKFWSKLPVHNASPHTIDGSAEYGGGCQGTLFVVSEDDIYAVDVLTQKLIAGTSDMFPDDNHGKFRNFTMTAMNNEYVPFDKSIMHYGFWATMETPGATEEESTIDIRPFSLYRSLGATVCRFWGPSLENLEDKDIPLNHLHKDFIRSYYNTSIVFDTERNSFLFANEPFSDERYKLFPKNDDSEGWIQQTTPPEGMPDLVNMEYELKTIANDGWSQIVAPANQAVAMMVYDGEDPEREGEHMLLLPATGKPENFGKTGNIGTAQPVYPFQTMHVVPKDEGELNITKEGAKLHLNGGCMSDIWVAVDNKFYKYLPFDDIQSLQREQLKLQLPADEKIAYFYQYARNDAGDIHKVVLSNNESTNEWHVRVFYAGRSNGSEMEQPEPDLLTADTGPRAEPDGDLLLEHFWGPGKATKCIYTGGQALGSFLN